MKKSILLMLCSAFCTTIAFAQNEDAEGCKDYPMFNRMNNYHISDCELKEFDAFAFTVANTTDEDAKKENVEGKYYHYTYVLNEDAPEVSDLQVFRNFENALKSINATIVGKVVESGNSYSFICAKVTKGKNEIWVKIESSAPEYYITIVEREAMAQVIQANDILKALNTDGYIALDILFDNGKSVIKAESQPIIEEIYSLLKNNTSLNVSIEGHTDNVGNADANKKLSDDRAKAVMNALLAKGIDAKRLTSAGWGQERPVADNRTEEGRAKNRRVEIVKK
ncbi:membrane protein [Tenuifilaceae bacterium CYCD]|nr:membrane protein [Tenuifilaceae bacterium CYCD]